MEIHQKAGPDYHRLKTMMKRSIEQNLRIKNFEARNGNHETNAVVKNQGMGRLLAMESQRARGRNPSGRMSRRIMFKEFAPFYSVKSAFGKSVLMRTAR